MADRDIPDRSLPTNDPYRAKQLERIADQLEELNRLLRYRTHSGP